MLAALAMRGETAYQDTPAQGSRRRMRQPWAMVRNAFGVNHSSRVLPAPIQRIVHCDEDFVDGDLAIVIRTRPTGLAIAPRLQRQEHDLAIPLVGGCSLGDKCKVVDSAADRVLLRYQDQAGHGQLNAEPFFGVRPRRSVVVGHGALLSGGQDSLDSERCHDPHRPALFPCVVLAVGPVDAL